MSSTNYTHFNGSFFETQDDKIINNKNVSVYTPLIYVSILIISLMIFASQYRKKKIEERTKLPSIFDEDDARDLYFLVKQLSLNEKVHEKVLKAALLNRGAEIIRRTIKLKEFAPQVEILFKNGSIDDAYWQRYQNEIKLLDHEFKECFQEAENLQSGWTDSFISVAKEICFNQALQRRYDSISTRKDIMAKQLALKIDGN